MTKKEFKCAMQRGLGRCILELEKAEDKEKYRELVLWGCTHELTYDAQSEGSRAYYFYEIINLFPNISSFLQATAKRMKQCIKSSSWEFSQCCQLLALYAADGNVYAEKELQICYNYLFDLLKRKRTIEANGIFPERDNFEELCVSMITYGNETECVLRYLNIAADMGSLILVNPLFSDWSFEWFQAASESNMGKRRLQKALKSKTLRAEEIQVYVTAMKQQQLERKERYTQRLTTADDVYNSLQAGERIPLVLMRRMQRNGKEQEVRKLAAYYEAESDENLRKSLLRLLANEDCAYALDVQQLILDSQSQNEQLQEYAFQVLANKKDEKIREYAMTIINDEGHRGDVVSMLAKNYRRQERDIFVRLVKRIPITYDDGIWHAAFADVMDMFREKQIKCPPKELLLYMYENTLCSFCREYIVKEMGRRRMLTKELLSECIHDSNIEIRKYAEKKRKRVTP